VVVNEGQLVASGTTPELLSRYTELDVLDRNGQRARVLWDRADSRASRPTDNGVLQVIGERTLTLEELLVALVKTKSAIRWRPRMDAA
jgi:hypothetical protein